MKLVVQIDRLVVDAPPASEPLHLHRLAEAIRAALAERIAVDGVPAAWSSSSLRPAVRADQIDSIDGPGLAAAIYGSLNR